MIVIENDIRVVVGIDFGTTYSGFAIAHIESSDVEVYQDWGSELSCQKVPTVLWYKDQRMRDWGFASKSTEGTMVKLFKLHLNKQTEGKQPLPDWMNGDVKIPITDYLKQMSERIKSMIDARWDGLVDYPRNIRFVVTVPVEWTFEARYKMLECLADAGIIPEASDPNVEVIDEAEAASIRCLAVCSDHNLDVDDAYIVVDCGGGTCDSTTRILSPDASLRQKNESKGNFLGANMIDEKFLKFVADRLCIDDDNFKTLREKHHDVIKHLVDDEFWQTKSKFNDDPAEFRPPMIDLYGCSKTLRRYSDISKRTEKGWILRLDYETVQGFFDDVVEGVLELIRNQVRESNLSIKTIFLVGGFGESPYLKSRVIGEFGDRVHVPDNPLTAVMRGAVQYGRSLETNPESENYGCSTTIRSRTLRFTYGTPAWSRRLLELGHDPVIFSTLAHSGVEYSNKRFCKKYRLKPGQRSVDMSVFYTSFRGVVNFYDGQAEELITWNITFDDDDSDDDDDDVKTMPRHIEMSLMFEPMPKVEMRRGRHCKSVPLQAPPNEGF